MKILCCGDLHVGRRSSRIAEEHDGRAFSCAAALESAVERAVGERVDAVLFAGDVVDRDNRFFEAFGPLERSLARLAAAGIPAVAVAGNHDFDVLRRLARSAGESRLRVLGEGGRWERFALDTRSGRLYVDGWSFPSEHVESSPLDHYSLSRPEDAPVVGLVHADPTDAESRYAPVSMARLREAPVSVWVVGHVHKPTWSETDGAAPVLVPGSVQALHPKEQGPHGPWLLEIDRAGGRVDARMLALSTVRYDEITIDLEGVEDTAGLEAAVMERLRAHRVAIEGDAASEELRYLCCTLRLFGRTRLHRRLASETRRIVDELEIGSEGRVLRVDRVIVETRPPIDLDEIARGRDPAGILAQYLLTLESGGSPAGFGKEVDAELGAETDELVEAVRDAAERAYRAKAYQEVSDDPEPDAAAARTLLMEQGYRLLDALIAQKEPGESTARGEPA
jgi:DNA repair exonuclease SbcCD nuclease subunit